VSRGTRIIAALDPFATVWHCLKLMFIIDGLCDSPVRMYDPGSSWIARMKDKMLKGS